MEKKKYLAPDLDIILLDEMDIITSSVASSGPDTNTGQDDSGNVSPDEGA